MISVIIPIYNASKFLAETVQSVQAQTYAARQIVLVDDGSTDASLALAAKLQEQDSRIAVFSQPNAGVSVARTLGLNLLHYTRDLARLRRRSVLGRSVAR